MGLAVPIAMGRRASSLPLRSYTRVCVIPPMEYSGSSISRQVKITGFFVSAADPFQISEYWYSTDHRYDCIDAPMRALCPSELSHSSTSIIQSQRAENIGSVPLNNRLIRPMLLPLQLVAYLEDRPDLLSRRTEGGAEGLDPAVHRPVSPLEVDAPHLVQELLPAEHLALVAHQAEQQLVLSGREGHQTAAHRAGPAG